MRQAGTGYNNIDLDACREKGIAICNVPEYTTEAMGDYAITLVMALSCSLAPQMKALAKGDRTYMHQCHLGHLDHFEIRGKTYGIIGGLGYIAIEHLQESFRSWHESHCLRYAINTFGNAWLRCGSGIFWWFVEELRFHQPHGAVEQTHEGLLNAACFDKMKPSAYVINTARGPIVDQDALIDALRKKKIAGAALDVFGEGSAPPPPLPDDSPLYDVFNEFENVILTPHIGWQRVEARQRVVDGCGDNIAKFTRGEAMNIDMSTGLPIRWNMMKQWDHAPAALRNAAVTPVFPLSIVHSNVWVLQATRQAHRIQKQKVDTKSFKLLDGKQCKTVDTVDTCWHTHWWTLTDFVMTIWFLTFPMVKVSSTSTVQCSERIVLHESASMSWATFESRERIMEYPPFVDVFYWNGSTFP